MRTGAVSCAGPFFLPLFTSVVEKLSEMGYEQQFERGFGMRKEAKMGRKGPFRCSVGLHCRLLRPLSDSFCTQFSESCASPCNPLILEFVVQRAVGLASPTLSIGGGRHERTNTRVFPGRTG
jgi:hypothetical protein